MSTAVIELARARVLCPADRSRCPAGRIGESLKKGGTARAAPARVSRPAPQLVGSLSEEVRLKRIREALELWQGLLNGEIPRRGGKSLEEVEDEDLIGPLIPYVMQEIVTAVVEDRVARVFCGLWYVVRYFPSSSAAYISVQGDDRVIWEGIRTAGQVAPQASVDEG